MKIASVAVTSLENARAFKFEVGLVRGRQVRCAADQPRYVLRQRIQNLARTFASSHSFYIGWKRRQALVPAVGKFAALHARELIRQIRKLLAVLTKQIAPLRMKPATTLADAFLKMLKHSVWH